MHTDDGANLPLETTYPPNRPDLRAHKHAKYHQLDAMSTKVLLLKTLQLC
jgi:hypothetical protein